MPSLLVQTGGRILQVNLAARQLFHLGAEENLNLERISRRIRPSEKFLELCGSEGHASLVVDGRMIDVASYRINLLPQLVMMLVLHLVEQAAGIGRR